MGNERVAATSAVGVAGAVLSLLTVTCCSIPALSTALVALLGVGGSVTLASLAPYRPWILAGSAVLLLFALYTSFNRFFTALFVR